MTLLKQSLGAQSFTSLIAIAQQQDIKKVSFSI